VLLHGSESWTIEAKDKPRSISAEMKFMRKTADGYIWLDFKQNTEISEELKITSIQDTISNYERDWRDHVDQISRSRLPKLTTHYTPKGRKSRQTYQESDRWTLRQEQATIGLYR
jgi:hypothetical protein